MEKWLQLHLEIGVTSHDSLTNQKKIDKLVVLYLREKAMKGTDVVSVSLHIFKGLTSSGQGRRIALPHCQLWTVEAILNAASISYCLPNRAESQR